MNTLIAAGGEVKALDSGRVSGWLVRFGDPEHTDVSPARDYFTRDTDFGDFARSAVLYAHAKDADLGPRRLAVGTLEVKDAGVWIEAQLQLRDDYERAIYGLAKAGKLGWSSGTASHLVEREPQANGSHKVVRWPLGLDASLTPVPAEPTADAYAIKSLDDAPAPPIAEAKAMHLGEHAEKDAALAAICRLGEAHYGRLHKHLHDDAMGADEKCAAMKACFDEHRDLAMKCVKALLSGPGPGSPEPALSAGMKAMRDTALAGLVRGLAIADHSEAVVAAVKGLSDRFAKRARARVEAGRALRTADAAAIKSLRDGLDALLATAPAAQPDPTTRAAAPGPDAKALWSELLSLEADVLCAPAGA